MPSRQINEFSQKRKQKKIELKPDLLHTPFEFLISCQEPKNGEKYHHEHGNELVKNVVVSVTFLCQGGVIIGWNGISGTHVIGHR